MAELAKARSMQPYIILYDYIAARCEKLAQGFYTAATWPGIEPRVCDTLVRRSTSKPPSWLTTVFHINQVSSLYCIFTKILPLAYELRVMTF